MSGFIANELSAFSCVPQILQIRSAILVVSESVLGTWYGLSLSPFFAGFCPQGSTGKDRPADADQEFGAQTGLAPVMGGPVAEQRFQGGPVTGASWLVGPKS